MALLDKFDASNPYTIREQGNRFCVVKRDTGETVPGGCHPTMKEAQAHLGALESNVSDAKKRKSESKKKSKKLKSSNNPDKQRAAARSGVDYNWKGR